MKPLIIFEIANNHNGDLSHGIEIINQLKETTKEFDYDFAFKLQYRNLDTFIHPKHIKSNSKYVKRFVETRLSDVEFLELKKAMNGFKTICTPFDEISVDKIVAHGYDIIKIASCSFTDWPLLEKIGETDKPLIASTAGSSIEEIRSVVKFFRHRGNNLSLMHCIGKYPTDRHELNMNSIDTLKEEFPGINIGYSGHEMPQNNIAIKIAISKGCSIFERHVAIGENINRYSSTPIEIKDWLYAANQAYKMCGNGSIEKNNDLDDLKRGVFSKNDIKKGHKISMDNIYYAIPAKKGQLLANDLSKYVNVESMLNIKAHNEVLKSSIVLKNNKDRLIEIIARIKKIIARSCVNIPNNVEIEISHHFGLDNYENTGVAIVNCINREYCKKLLIVLPGQIHPKHYHVKKEETFHVLWGDLKLYSDDSIYLTSGDIYTVNRKEKHGFYSQKGCVFEEVSTTHHLNDSYYEMELSKDRKTKLNYWDEWKA